MAFSRIGGVAVALLHMAEVGQGGFAESALVTI
jgi:hypothetical protein